VVLPPRRSASRTKSESTRRQVDPSSPSFATPPRLGQPGGGTDSGGSHTGERGAPSRGTLLAVASLECSPSSSWACRRSPLARWGCLRAPMVVELVEATTSPRLRILPGHLPAVYPLDRCASHELGDLVGSPTRAHPRSVFSASTTYILVASSLAPSPSGR
jgi:hypothetical protein